MEERPQVRLKVTRTGNGILIMVPMPELGATLNFITSKEYLGYLLDGSLKNNLLACQFMGESDLEQFLTKEEREIINTNKMYVNKFTDDNPMGAKAQRERKEGMVSIKDDW